MFNMMVPRCNAGKPLLRVQCSQVPAGHSTWPVHSHSLAEEAIFVLAGTGVLKTPAGTRVRLERALSTGEEGTGPSSAVLYRTVLRSNL